MKCVEASRLPFEMRGTSHKVSSKMTCAIQCLHPAWVVAAQSAPAPANPALPLTAVMTKAKAVPKIGSRRNSKASHASPKMRAKWSPAHAASSVMTTAAAAADLDPLPEPQQPAQEAVPVPDVPSTAHQDAKEESDAGEVTSQKSDEKKEDKHEKKEDKHEEKTESDH